jgi:hypothetical protein
MVGIAVAPVRSIKAVDDFSLLALHHSTHRASRSPREPSAVQMAGIRSAADRDMAHIGHIALGLLAPGGS